MTDRLNWMVQQGRRQPHWILASLGWLVILSIAIPLLAAVVVVLAAAIEK